MSALFHTASEIKIARPDVPIHPLLAERWSPRAYDEQPVEPEKLRSVFEAARWSASSGNGQPWFFLVAEREQTELFSRMVSCLSEGNVSWASLAPVLGIGVARLTRSNGMPNRHAYYDLGLAVQNLIVQAAALGLHVRQMGGFSPERARQLFHIPDEHEAVVMFALGYRGDPETLAGTQREGELAPRLRRPLVEFVFDEEWGQPAQWVTLER